jgi:hypothetical protein
MSFLSSSFRKYRSFNSFSSSAEIPGTALGVILKTDREKRRGSHEFQQFGVLPNPLDEDFAQINRLSRSDGVRSTR